MYSIVFNSSTVVHVVERILCLCQLSCLCPILFSWSVAKQRAIRRRRRGEEKKIEEDSFKFEIRPVTVLIYLWGDALTSLVCWGVKNCWRF